MNLACPEGIVQMGTSIRVPGGPVDIHICFTVQVFLARPLTSRQRHHAKEYQPKQGSL